MEVEPPTKVHHFAFVDALRGFAILGVLMSHSNVAIGGQMHPSLERFTSAGRYGVQLFFVVSAFTLFWSLRCRSTQDRKPVHAFFARRFFRIVPLFWVAIAFYLLQPSEWRPFAAPNGIGFWHILSTALLVHGWHPTTINSVVNGDWSIAAEAMFYLCIPFLYAKITTLQRAAWIFLASVLLVAVGTPIATKLLQNSFPESWHDLVAVFVYFSFPTHFPVFCLGFVLYFILMGRLRKPSEISENKPPSKRQFSALLLSAALSLMLVDIPGHVLFGLAFVLVAWALAIHPVKAVVNRITRGVGLVSYSAYLWHFWILDRLSHHVTFKIHISSSAQLNADVAFLATFLILVPTTLTAAWVSYRLIERPFQRLGRRFISAMQWGPIERHVFAPSDGPSHRGLAAPVIG